MTTSVSFRWNGRTLDSITGNSKTIEFKYNENGLRTKKEVEQGSVTTAYTYVWNGDKLVSQSGGTNTFYFFYASGNTAGYGTSEYAPDGFVLNGTDIYFYTKNLQGDVTGIVNSNGAVVTSYTYDSWGNVLSVTGTLASTIGASNPIRYRGYYYDAETGLYYLQSRYYNPEWGRFLNADSTDYLGYSGTVLSCNLFLYCENNCISYTDSCGDIFSWDVKNKKLNNSFDKNILYQPSIWNLQNNSANCYAYALNLVCKNYTEKYYKLQPGAISGKVFI